MGEFNAEIPFNRQISLTMLLVIRDAVGICQCKICTSSNMYEIIPCIFLKKKLLRFDEWRCQMAEEFLFIKSTAMVLSRERESRSSEYMGVDDQ